MVYLTVKIEGMSTKSDASLVKSAIKGSFPIKKISVSHKDGEVSIATQQDILDGEIRNALEPLGYRVGSVERNVIIRRNRYGKIIG